MAPGRIGLLLIASVLTVSFVASPARAGDDAAAYQQRATAAFALGHFAEAAEDFEKAFAIRSNPALLYNAAQAHRLGGNKERALLLYENYMRVYGNKEERAEEVQHHIDELKKVIASDKAVATPPPTVTSGASGGTPAAAPPLPAAPPPPSSTAPVLVAQPAAPPPSGDDSLVKKPWFWVVVGGGVVAAAVVVILLSQGGGNTIDPSASLGTVTAN